MSLSVCFCYLYAWAVNVVNMGFCVFYTDTRVTTDWARRQPASKAGIAAKDVPLQNGLWRE